MLLSDCFAETTYRLRATDPDQLRILKIRTEHQSAAKISTGQIGELEIGTTKACSSRVGASRSREPAC